MIERKFGVAEFGIRALLDTLVGDGDCNICPHHQRQIDNLTQRVRKDEVSTVHALTWDEMMLDNSDVDDLGGAAVGAAQRGGVDDIGGAAAVVVRRLGVGDLGGRLQVSTSVSR